MERFVAPVDETADVEDGGELVGHGDPDGGDDDRHRGEDVAYLIGQGRFVAASKVAARQSGADRAGRRAASVGRRALVRVANWIESRHRALRLLAGCAAGAAAIALFGAIFVVEVPVGDEVTGGEGSATLWSAGMRISAGGSYGLVLAVAAPALLAATLLIGRWWRPVLLAVTAYSVHWLEVIADTIRLQRELDFEQALVTWQLRGTVALAFAVALGCVVLAAGDPGPATGRVLRREVPLAVVGLATWALTWRRPLMVLETDGPGGSGETFGRLRSLPLSDLARIFEAPFDYAIGYLPAVLVLLVSIAMFLRSGRGRPDLRVGVWVGLAVGMLADVVQRMPSWYDSDPYGAAGYGGVDASLTWSPSRGSLILLIASAVAFVSAAWSAWSTIDAEEDELPEIEVLDLGSSPLWGERA